MKKLIAFVSLLALPAGAFAYFNGGASAVTGSDDYQSYRFFGELGTGGGLSLRPTIDTFKDKYVSDTMLNYGLRAGLDKDTYGVGLKGSLVPEKNGYERTGLAADVTFSLTPSNSDSGRLAGPRSGGAGAKSAKGVTRIDVGGSLSYYRHKFSGTGVSYENNETDMSLFAGAQILGTVLSGTYLKNLGYSKDIDAACQPYMDEEPGLMTFERGYIDQSWNVRLDWGMLPVVTPYLSYTYTKYKNTFDSSKTYLLGASTSLNMVNIYANYQIFDPGSSGDNRTAMSLGAGLAF
ncbi:MAG: hypothetical protein PHW69_00395 [Elusimicrobiaceae bacterium]|nr:hypothetical protein [Elusimicrobiaceae bacterium]